MKKFSHVKLLSIILTIALAGAIGCSTKPHGYSSKPPAWVEMGSGAFDDGGSKVFYGVGAVSGVKNKPLAKTASDNRARAEIAKTFETYSASLMRDYAASTTAGAAVDGSTDVAEEQHIEQSIKTFSAVTLSGVMIIDHWTDTTDGTVYALAKLDLEKFKNSLDKMNELNAGIKEYVRRNAERSFDKLAAEEARHGK